MTLSLKKCACFQESIRCGGDVQREDVRLRAVERRIREENLVGVEIRLEGEDSALGAHRQCDREARVARVRSDVDRDVARLEKSAKRVNHWLCKLESAAALLAPSGAWMPPASEANLAVFRQREARDVEGILPQLRPEPESVKDFLELHVGRMQELTNSLVSRPTRSQL